MVVVDASVFIQVLLETSKSGLALAELAEAKQWLAPDLVDLEVLNGIRKPLLRGEMSEVRAEQAYELYRQMNIVRFQTGELLQKVWNVRHNLTPYDATYVLLALSFGIPLITSDRGMHNASRSLVQCKLV